MKLIKRDSTGNVTFAMELPAGYDDRTRFLEYHEHLLIVHPLHEPFLVDRATNERIPLDSQKQIEARLLAAKYLGEIRSNAIH